MEKPATTNFITIDDDTQFNMITAFTIRKGILNSVIHTFVEPEKGLEFIQNIPKNEKGEYVVLLDINMPTLSGWEVLDKIKTMDKNLQDRLKIFILSSSVNLDDKEIAENNGLVSGYLEKPIRLGTLELIMADMKN